MNFIPLLVRDRVFDDANLKAMVSHNLGFLFFILILLFFNTIVRKPIKKLWVTPCAWHKNSFQTRFVWELSVKCPDKRLSDAWSTTCRLFSFQTGAGDQKTLDSAATVGKPVVTATSVAAAVSTDAIEDNDIKQQTEDSKESEAPISPTKVDI